MTADLRLTADSPLVAAGGWYLVQRLADDRSPAVWRREPIACWTLGRTAEGVELVAVLGDGRVTPRRSAEEGRDGADFHQCGQAVGFCGCASPVTFSHDPTWCSHCAGWTVKR